MTPVTVRDIEVAIARRFPPERAEAWDRFGLLAGDPAAQVSGVTIALDADQLSLDAAVRAGSNVLLTHHPAFLTPPARLAPEPGPSGVVFSAIANGVALINAHTNLDRDPEAQRLLPQALGLTPAEPLERDPMPMALVTAYAPPDAEERIVDEMAAAGAGRLGGYERCNFASQGTGSFTPLPGTDPYEGEVGEASSAQEVRIEMACPRSRARAVVAAAVAAHPYEEPLVTVTEIAAARNAAALGMVCEPEADATVAHIAQRAVEAFGAPPRVWGDPSAPAGVTVTTTGSGGSLLWAANATGATTFICGEVRYHDALEARAAGIAVIELGHDVSEWPLVALLTRAVGDVPGIEAGMIRALEPRRGWWSP